VQGEPRAVFSGHVRLPTKPHTSHASVGECFPHAKSTRTLHRSWPLPPRERAYHVCVACHCYTSTV
jgi:hypothetical protein